MWRRSIAEGDETEGIKWRWQIIYSAMIEAPMAQETVGSGLTGRRKNGSKRIVDRRTRCPDVGRRDRRESL